MSGIAVGGGAARLRALGTGWMFWLAMLMASAFGTNLGDLWTGRLGLPAGAAFGSLLAVCGVAIWWDRRAGVRLEAGYWVAIVVLRAAATNVGDFMTERLGLAYLPVALAVAALALVVGSRTRRGVVAGEVSGEVLGEVSGAVSGAGASPVIDGWYWAAMFLAGVFGTVGGDLVNHTIGVLVSAAVLTAVLLAVLGVRGRWLAGSMLAYWAVVLAERAAGTPIGDGLASRRGVGLGLQVATVVTGALFLAALALRARRRGVRFNRT